MEIIKKLRCPVEGRLFMELLLRLPNQRMHVY